MGAIFTACVSLMVELSSPVQESVNIVCCIIAADVSSARPGELVQLLPLFPAMVHAGPLLGVTRQVETFETFQYTFVLPPDLRSDGFTCRCPVNAPDELNVGGGVRQTVEPEEQYAGAVQVVCVVLQSVFVCTMVLPEQEYSGAQETLSVPCGVPEEALQVLITPPEETVPV
jgi:hypothetical protein